ncbi:MAG: deoxyribonuclease IV [Bacilli bacterium]|nr:deoxyribonuclease IV [Bacilli bacterium]
MLIIGSHVGFNNKDQLLGSLEESLKYGSNTFMFYTGAPQNTLRSKINDDVTKKAIIKMKENGISIDNIIVHAPYIINLANNKEDDKYNFSIRFLKEEINRCEELGIKYMVLHPGSHVGLGIDVGLQNIIFGLNEVLKADKNVIILLETMAGKGTELGTNFKEIKTIIDGVNNKAKIGVCLDTCHLNDAGYNIRDFDKVLDEFDSIIGLNYIHCIHINDSKNECGAHKDRHENIGYGTIGFDNLLNVIYNKRLENIPKILETPWIGDYAPYKDEIDMIKNKEFNPNLKK